MPAKSVGGFGGNARVLPKSVQWAKITDPVEPKKGILSFEGANYLRLRLVLSTLTTKPVRITEIRATHDSPGLKAYEANFLRMLDKITNGSKFEINETGTALSFKPGVLIGGSFEHECNNERGISYYLEPLLALAPFAKKPITIRLKGVTANEVDVSVDTIKSCSLPVMRRFLPDDDDLSLTITARGVAPGGGGEVIFSCPVCRSLRPAQVKDQGKIKRIRGLAFALRVSPSMANRIVDTAKGELLKFIPDVYINTDHMRGPKAGKSPGFGAILVAESSTGCFWTGEAISKSRKLRGNDEDIDLESESPNGEQISVPEEVGREAAHNLLEEIFRGGCVDSSAQSLALLFMALGPPDVSKVVFGPLSKYSMECLRLIKRFLGVMFKLEPFDASTAKVKKEGEEGAEDVVEDVDDEELAMGAVKVLATCVGVGFTNLNKTVS